jgi:hypothetical protein
MKLLFLALLALTPACKRQKMEIVDILVVDRDGNENLSTLYCYKIEN